MTPPGPHPLRMLLRHSVRDRLAMFREIASYGDVAFVRTLRERVFVIRDFELVRDVLRDKHQLFMKAGVARIKRLLGEGLITSDGETHLRQRRMLLPLFHRDRLAAHAPVMVKHADRISSEWKAGEIIDVSAEMSRIALAIVAEALFGTNVDSEADEIRRATTTVAESMLKTNPPLLDLLERLPLPPFQRVVAARRRLDTIMYTLIRKRRQNGANGTDVLQRLLEARDDAQASITDREVRDHVTTLFLAGYETTVNALSWTWILLGQSADDEAALHGEVDSVLGGRLPEIGDVPALRVLDRVVNESLRLYPPVYLMSRRSVAACELGGYRVPAGSLAVVPTFLLHRDPCVFADPDRFVPDRWTTENGGNAFVPFGGGTRRCIGQGFAMQELILVIATIARRWRLRLAPGTRVVPQAMVTLRPAGGGPLVTVEART